MAANFFGAGKTANARLTMYKLELDLHLYYVPPMEENGQGIILTRTVLLPFPPSAEITIQSRKFDDGPEPLGFHIKEITWDIDRQVFLAHSDVVSGDMPFPFILGDLRNWIEHGWRLGSYLDGHPEEQEGEEREAASAGVQDGLPDDETMEKWPTLSPRSRPEQFNRVFGVITRMLAETHNAESLAYAMHRTKLFFTTEQLRGEKSAAKDRFSKARDEFYKLPFEKRAKWIDRIVAAYPSLADEMAG